MSRVDHWSDDIHNADELRAESAIATMMMAEALALDPEKLGRNQKSPVDGSGPTTPPIPAIRETARIVAEKEAEIDKLCVEIEEMQTAPLSGRRIALAVAKAYRITFVDLISHRRDRHLVWARQHAMWLMKKHTNLSLPLIGKILGKRDHTTVIHGIKAHQARLDKGRA